MEFPAWLPVLPPACSSHSRRLYVVFTHPAVAAQLVAVVEALLLRQRQPFPPLVEVAQPRVNLVVVHPTWGAKGEGGEQSYNLKPHRILSKVFISGKQKSRKSRCVWHQLNGKMQFNVV